MGNKKIFEFLNLLSVLVRTGEINLKSYAATTGLSEVFCRSARVFRRRKFHSH